jgi:hypothetical protein
MAGLFYCWIGRTGAAGGDPVAGLGGIFCVEKLLPPGRGSQICLILID